MKCLFCGSEQSAVIDKRAVKTTGEIRRRRECLKCHKRFTTYEKISSFELLVIKRDGRREQFDQGKIRAGLVKALEKRPGIDKLDILIDKIVKSLKTKGEKEVESKIIGNMVLSELKKIDQVAYLRFASVYREFKDPGDFTKELKNLK